MDRIKLSRNSTIETSKHPHIQTPKPQEYRNYITFFHLFIIYVPCQYINLVAHTNMQTTNLFTAKIHVAEATLSRTKREGIVEFGGFPKSNFCTKNGLIPFKFWNMSTKQGKKVMVKLNSQRSLSITADEMKTTYSLDEWKKSLLLLQASSQLLLILLNLCPLTFFAVITIYAIKSLEPLG